METFTSPHVKHRGYTFATNGTVWAPDGSRLKTRINKNNGRKYVLVRHKVCYPEDVIREWEERGYDQ